MNCTNNEITYIIIQLNEVGQGETPRNRKLRGQVICSELLRYDDIFFKRQCTFAYNPDSCFFLLEPWMHGKNVLLGIVMKASKEKKWANVIIKGTNLFLV